MEINVIPFKNGKSLKLAGSHIFRRTGSLKLLFLPHCSFDFILNGHYSWNLERILMAKLSIELELVASEVASLYLFFY